MTHVDPNGIDAFSSEAPEAPSASPAALIVPPATSNPRVATKATGWPITTVVQMLAAVALVEALIIAGLVVARSGTFDSPGGHLVVETEPAGAEVWVDGRHLGTTPISVVSDAGPRTLRIDAHGTSRTMTVDVAGGQVTHARVDFVQVSAVAISEAPLPNTAPQAPPATAPALLAAASSLGDVPVRTAPPSVARRAPTTLAEPRTGDTPAKASRLDDGAFVDIPSGRGVADSVLRQLALSAPRMQGDAAIDLLVADEAIQRRSE